MIHLFSFFSGAGFLDLGFETENYEVVYVNEYHEPLLEAYKHSRTKLGIPPPEYGYYPSSITDFFNAKQKALLRRHLSESRKKGNITGFVGGPPCPDFSVGGKNRGKEGTNGILSLSYIELIKKQKPDFFLFENVKGLWRTKRHREFYEELKEELKGSGYIITDHLVNTIEYGVAQARDRIFLFGVHPRFAKDLGLVFDKKKKEFPEGSFPWQKYSRYPGKTAFEYPWPKTVPFEEDSTLPKPNGIPEELTVEHWFRKNRVADHPNSVHFFKPRAGLQRFLTVEEGDDSKKSFKRLHRWRYSPTACYGNNEVHLHPYKARRLTAAEALAVQSLPKKYEFPEKMSLSNMFKAIGNGVPFLAAKMLSRTIKEFLGVGK